MSDDDNRRPRLRLVPGASDSDTTNTRETADAADASAEAPAAWPPAPGYWATINDLSSQTILLLGTSEPLGLGIATGLADYGARVAIAERDLDISKVAAKAATRPGNATALAMNMDPARPEQVRQGIAAIEQITGGIDGLVAVISLNAPFRTSQSEAAPATLTLPDVIHLVRAAGRRMSVRGGGRVLLVAAGVPSDPAIAAIAIGGLNEFVKTMAAAFIPHGVSVNALIVPQTLTPATSAGTASSGDASAPAASTPEQTETASSAASQTPASGEAKTDQQAEPATEDADDSAAFDDGPSGDDLVLSQAPMISFPAGGRPRSEAEASQGGGTTAEEPPLTEGPMAAGIGAALYFCGPNARYLTGQSITIGKPTVIGVKPQKPS